MSKTSQRKNTRTGKKPSPRRQPRTPVNWRPWAQTGAIAVLVAGAIMSIAWAGGPSALMAQAGAAIDRGLVRHGFAVTDIRFSGAERTPLGDLDRAAGIDRAQSILAADLNGVRARVEALPWVRQAAVSRLLPGTIRIDIVERQAVALWQHERRFWLIDQDGAPIVEVAGNAYPHLGLVVGAGANDAAAQLRAMLASAPALAARVTAAVRVGGRRWDLNFDGGTTVALPETDPEEAWRRLAAMEERHGLLAQGYGRLDLRQPGLLVARPPAAGPVVRHATDSERAT